MTSSITALDWVARRRSWFLFWGAPSIAIAVSVVVTSDQMTLGIIWSAALLLMSGACLMNARRCGRLHCYLTGPFFLVMALLSMAEGLGIISLGPHAWPRLGAILVAGGAFLHFVPEKLWGKYRQRQD